MDDTTAGEPKAGDAPSIRVEDKRRFLDVDDEEPPFEQASDDLPATVPIVELDAMRARAEAAERKLYDYAAAFDKSKAEQEQVRARLERDVATKVDVRFGALVADLLEAVDDLDLALDHARTVPAAETIVQGLEIARDRFVAMLLRNGVERLDILGEPFDPNNAEALALEPVEDATLDGKVVRIVRPGYRMGDRAIRPARVTVGRAAN